MTEFDAEAMLVSHLNLTAYRVAQQVRMGLRVPDVVVRWQDAPEESVLEVIEVKLTDWRKAAQQAYLSGTYADLASIAMPRSREHLVDRAYLAELGIGLIVFDEAGWSRTLEPILSRVADPVREAVHDRLEGAR